MASTSYARAGSAALSIRFVSLLILVTITTLFATSQHAAAQSCPATSISASFSKQSVAVGDEVDLIVTVNNNSDERLISFNVYIASTLDALIGNDDFKGFFEHFVVLETHHPVGRVGPFLFSDQQNSQNINAGLQWYLSNTLSLERLGPGESTTLRVRLKVVGQPGTIEVPVQLSPNNSFLDCSSRDTTTLEITEGDPAQQLVVQKTLMENSLYECVRLGDELMSLWQVRNTSDQPRIVRFRDTVPGHLFFSPGASSFDAFFTDQNGTYIVPSTLTTSVSGEYTTLQSATIEIPPHTTVWTATYYDVSAYAIPSKLVSPFYVWETTIDDDSSLPPADAIEFLNEEVPVCKPIITKTGSDATCGLDGEAQIDYELNIDRVILGSVFAPHLLEDLHAKGTAYIPSADPGYSGILSEYQAASDRTIWMYYYYGFGDGLTPGVDDEAPHFYNDRLRLRYSASVQNSSFLEYVNTFNLYSTSAGLFPSESDPKLATLSMPLYGDRKPGDNLALASDLASKVSNGPTGELLEEFLSISQLVSRTSHTTQNSCPFIEGYKFNDVNGNGVRDAGEPGVESWMITAQSSEGTHVAVTDENGYYRMAVPYAVWQVREIYQLGWVQSAPGGEGFYNVAISEQVRSARLDFGNWRPAVVSGTKYHDYDGSGSRGPGEPGVEDVRIELRDLGGNVVAHTLTDADGYYEFNQVAPGHYAVYEEANPALRQSQPGPAEGGYHYVVTTSGSNHPGLDFGNYIPIEINGTVVQVAKVTEHDPTVRDFRDLKIQLVRTGPTGEPAPLKAAPGAGGSTVASDEAILLDLDDNGAFEAPGLQPGNWLVSVVLAEYWSVVGYNPVQVLVTSGFSATILFEVTFDALAAPEVRTGSITGSVFRNTTADHLFDKSTDVMVSAQSVRLLGTSERGAVVDLQATTASDGSYTFTDLPAGNYVVSLAGTADSLKVGWPWADSHRIVLGEGQHVGTSFAAHATTLPPAAVDADLPWKERNWTAFANLWMRIDDDGDASADRRNFLSGPAILARTSANGAWPVVVAHADLQMAGTDSLGRTIRANSPAGGSLASVAPSIAASPTSPPGLWTQGLDLNLDLADGLWYGPTASSLSNEPAVVAVAGISEWLSLHTTAAFTATAGAAPVLRDPLGSPVATVLSARYVLTPGPDFGLTPKRFDADAEGDGDGEDDGGGTGSGDGGIGTSDPDDRADVPKEFALGSAYPNPFNPSTVVPFELAAAGHVNLAVYDVMGRRVATLVNGTMSAGRHTLAWDASGLPSGVYMLRLTAGGKVMTSKATLLK